MSLEDLRQKTGAQLNATSPAEWGEQITLAEFEEWFGQYLEERPDPGADGRPAYLLLSDAGEPCFLRGGLVMLGKRMAEANPSRGDHILIIRGQDATGKNGPYQNWAVASEAQPAGTEEQPARTVQSSPSGQLAPTDSLPF